jgi:hypothetical protein
MAWRKGGSLWCPFAQTADHEQGNRAAGEEGSILQELALHLEGRNWSLYSRLARQRAAYFADIEELAPPLAQAQRSPRPGWIIETPTRPLPVKSGCRRVLHDAQIWHLRWPIAGGLWRHARSVHHRQ